MQQRGITTIYYSQDAYNAHAFVHAWTACARPCWGTPSALLLLGDAAHVIARANQDLSRLARSCISSLGSLARTHARKHARMHAQVQLLVASAVSSAVAALHARCQRTRISDRVAEAAGGRSSLAMQVAGEAKPCWPPSSMLLADVGTRHTRYVVAVPAAAVATQWALDTAGQHTCHPWPWSTTTGTDQRRGLSAVGVCSAVACR